MRKFELNLETIFLLLVAGLSGFSLVQTAFAVWHLQGIISLVGLVSAALFFANRPQFKPLLYIWIFAQVIIFDRAHVDASSGEWVQDQLWDLVQGFSLKFGINNSSSNHRFELNFNLMTILYLVFLKILNQSQMVGKQLLFKLYRKDGNLEDILPRFGVVVKRVELGSENDWLHVELETPFEYDGNNIQDILIRAKNGETIKKHKKMQIVYFRIIPNLSKLQSGMNKPDYFPFIDWALCE